MKTLFGLLALSLLTGCATTSSMVGKPASSLVERYGLPSQREQVDDVTIYQYEQCRRTAYVPVGRMLIGRQRCQNQLYFMRGQVVFKEATVQK